LPCPLYLNTNGPDRMIETWSFPEKSVLIYFSP